MLTSGDRLVEIVGDLVRTTKWATLKMNEDSENWVVIKSEESGEQEARDKILERWAALFVEIL